MRCSLSEHQQDNYCQELFKLPIFLGNNIKYEKLDFSNMGIWKGMEEGGEKGKVSSKVGGNGGNDGGIME